VKRTHFMVSVNRFSAGNDSDHNVPETKTHKEPANFRAALCVPGSNCGY
jgi:hypothetical protein